MLKCGSMQKNTITEKKCSVCKRVLPIIKFRRYEHQSGVGYRGSCRQCERARERERRHQNKAQITNDNNVEDNYRFLDFYKKIKSGA